MHLAVDLASLYAPNMAKVTAKLRCLDLRGETTHTRWGHVSFDRDGLSELEVDEDDLQMLRDIRWLDEGAEQRAKWAADEKAEKVSAVTGAADNEAAEKAADALAAAEAASAVAAAKKLEEEKTADKAFDTSDSEAATPQDTSTSHTQG